MAGNLPGKPPVLAVDAPVRASSSYPPQFAARMAGRRKQALGDMFGLTNIGINRTSLSPGSQSSLHHAHAVQDEFVYVLSGELILVTDQGEAPLSAGMCAGFPHGGTAHHLINRSAADAVYLEIGDRLPGDSAVYPDDDLQADWTDAGWRFTRKDGTPY